MYPYVWPLPQSVAPLIQKLTLDKENHFPRRLLVVIARLRPVIDEANQITIFFLIVAGMGNIAHYVSHLKFRFHSTHVSLHEGTRPYKRRRVLSSRLSRHYHHLPKRGLEPPISLHHDP
jgi:hypothetical protein